MIDAITPMARQASGKDEPERPLARVVRIDRVERGDAEDDRGDERDLVALEEVGSHAGAVTDVVAHVVGDRGRVAGVVLGDAGFDLAHEVGADVGRLREDAAAYSEEQREQRATEAEPDEDRRRRVLKDHDDDRRAEQAEADREHAGDATGAERDLQRGGHRPGLRGGRSTDVAPRRERHPDEAGEARHEAAEDERERAVQPGLAERQRVRLVRLHHRNRREKHDHGERDQDEHDRLELPVEVRAGALLDRLRDLLHLRRPRVFGEHEPREGEADDDGEQRRQRAGDEDRPLAARQRELLVAALGGEDVRHEVPSLCGRARLAAQSG